MRIFVVDAFTSERFQGNRAGVVLNAKSLSSREKQQIASEINASETAFAEQLDSGDFKVDYYTPTTEVDFCGHATVGTFHTLVNLGIVPLEKGSTRLHAHTRAGVFPVELSTKAGEILVGMTHSQSELAEIEASKAGLANALNLNEDALSPIYPPRYSKTANWHLIIGVKDQATLDSITYDTERLSTILLHKRAITAHVFAPGSANVFHVRNFCPTVGIPEDPGTGSAAAAFGAYLANTGQLQDSATELRIYQGEKMGRKCQIDIDVRMNEGKFASVTFFGTAVPSFELLECRIGASVI